MRLLTPKHMKMELKDKKTGQVNRTIDKDYFSIGQVRELFREVTEDFDMAIVVTPDRFLRGTLAFTARLKGTGMVTFKEDGKTILDDGLAPDETKGKVMLDMLMESTITTTDDWNKLLSRMEKRLKTIAIGLPDPEDEQTEIEEIERVESGNQPKEGQPPKGYPLSSKQAYLLEQIFKGTGLGHDYIAPYFNYVYKLNPPIASAGDVNTTMLDEFLGHIALDVVKLPEKPASFMVYTDIQKKAIFADIVATIKANNLQPVQKLQPVFDDEPNFIDDDGADPAQGSLQDKYGAK